MYSQYLLPKIFVLTVLEGCPLRECPLKEGTLYIEIIGVQCRSYMSLCIVWEHDQMIYMIYIQVFATPLCYSKINVIMVICSGLVTLCNI